jgi:hypothetical protein
MAPKIKYRLNHSEKCCVYKGQFNFENHVYRVMACGENVLHRLDTWDERDWAITPINQKKELLQYKNDCWDKIFDLYHLELEPIKIIEVDLNTVRKSQFKRVIKL